MDDVRIGDAEREAAVASLGEQYALGRLSKEEFDERSDAAWSARTNRDLAPLFTDLPVGRAAPAQESLPRNRGMVRPRTLVVLLVVLGTFSLLSHLPVLLIFVLAWFLFGRLSRPGPRRAGSQWSRGYTRGS